MIERRFALIIGTSSYDDPDLKKLIAPGQEAKALADVLKDPLVGGFDVKILLNESSYRINEEIEEFFDDRQRNDVLFVYFSCHGLKDVDGRLYYAAVNTKRKHLHSTGISANYINDMMLRSRSHSQILILDCCYSGAFAKGAVSKADRTIHTGDYFEGRGRIVLTASDAMQYSFEGDSRDGVGRRSIFTSAIIHGLGTGDADIDKNGVISYRELYDYAFDQVMEETPAQTPQIWTFGVEGDVIVAKNPSVGPKGSTEKETTKKAGGNRSKSRKGETVTDRLSKPSSKVRKAALVSFILIGIVTSLFLMSTYIGQDMPSKTVSREDQCDSQICFLKVFGSLGQGNGQFINPSGITVDSSENVYTSDIGNSRIQKFTRNGTFVTTWGTEGAGNGQLNITLGVAVDSSDNVYVADSGNFRIQKFTSDGTYVTKWGSEGSGEGEFNGLGGVAVDSSDNVYVADRGNSRIQKFTSDGTFVTMWGSEGSGKAEFKDLFGVAVDSSDNVYVADSGNSRIQKFTSDGTFVIDWRTSGSSQEQSGGFVSGPFAVAVSSSDIVYVADPASDRIQMWWDKQLPSS